MMITSAIIAIRPLPIAIHHRRHHEDGGRGVKLEMRAAQAGNWSRPTVHSRLPDAFKSVLKFIQMYSNVFKHIERRLYLHIVYGLKV